MADEHISLLSLGATPVVHSPDADVSALGSAGRGFTGMLPLGPQAYAAAAGALQNEPYLQERKELDKEIEADKLNFPASRFAGQAAGLAVPIAATALTGGVAAPESLAGVLGEGAGVGASYGAGNAIDTLARGGSHQQAAEDVALGAGVGAAGAGAAKGIGALLAALRGKAGGLAAESAVSDEVVHPDEMPPMAHTAPLAETPELTPTAATPIMPTSEATMQAASMPPIATPMAGDAPSTAPAMPVAPNVTAIPGAAEAPPVYRPSFGAIPSDSELRAKAFIQAFGGNMRQVRNLPGLNPTQTVNHLADIAMVNSTPERNLFAFTDRPSARLDKFNALHQESGKVLGDMAAQVDLPPVPAQAITDQIIQSVKLPTPPQKELLDNLTQQINAYADTSGGLSFQRLRQLKTDLGDQAFPTGNPNNGDPLMKRAYHAVSNLEEAQLHAINGRPGIDADKFMKAKAAYNMTSRVIPMLRFATARDLAGRPALTELLSGHPVVAAGKVANEYLNGPKNIVGFHIANALDKPGAGGLTEAAAQTVASRPSININHSALTPWRDLFRANAAGATTPDALDKAYTTTDYTLQQRDPAYAAAKQKMADDEMAPL